MKFAVATLLASAAVVRAGTKDCHGEAQNVGGNYYCGLIDHLLYEGVGYPTTFPIVTGMGPDGSCQKEDRDTGLSWNQGLSIHIRGPVHCKQVAAYTMTSNQKRDAPHEEAHAHARRHAHHAHHAAHKRDGDMVTATINGEVVSWANDYTPTPAPQPDVVASVSSAVEDVKSAVKSASASYSKSEKPAPPSGSDYVRSAYYDSQSGTCDGLVFMGNYGGQGSGVFDTTWGNSLSYLNADGDGGAPEPQCLKDGFIPSNKEFSIFSDTLCDESCDYSRVPEIAYQGFTGADKVWLFEFSMPSEGGDSGMNANMPAIWSLDSRIPRTGQYTDCTCWPKCPELDIFEVLSPGSTKAKATIHSGNPGGSSDYFDRPMDTPIKLATVFHSASESISIKVIPGDTDFGAGLTAAQVQAWIDLDKSSPLSSLFQMG